MAHQLLPTPRTNKTPLHCHSRPKTGLLATAFACIVFLAFNATPLFSAVNSDYSHLPLALQNTATPMVMLSASKDHQLFMKAYSDYDDLDGDGTLDTTYKNSITYVGYFDSQRCYRYNTSSQFFEPVRKVLDTAFTCNNSVLTERLWSGNFLNWGSMTRMDVIRKVLYGGLRSTDGAPAGTTAATTVLERAYLPSDSHSFAKYYNGADLAEITPYTSSAITINQDSSQSGITLCNTSVGDVTAKSENSTATPRIRVAKGNFSLWASSEKMQCLFLTTNDSNNEEAQDPRRIWEAGAAKPFYGNNAILGSSIYSDLGYKYIIESPNITTDRLHDYIARVKTCVSFDMGGSVKEYEPECRAYTPYSFKPTGVLQRFGESGAIQFGLMTGSYSSNKNGGVLRKNIGGMTDEINSDGTFKSLPDAGGGIIKTFDAFRITGFIKRNADLDSSGNGYSGWNTYLRSGDCGEDWGDTGNGFSNGECTSWGNPFAEILAESYRYFSGATSPTSAYAANDDSKFSNAEVKKALKAQSWSNNPLRPQTDSPYACSSFNVFAFNASTVSYDADSLSGLTLGGSSVDVNAATNTVGAGENIGKLSGGSIDASGPKYFIGKNSPSSTSPEAGVCTLKPIGQLADVRGTCPDSPNLDGSYLMAGLAYFANTQDINTGSGFSGKQTVSTFGVSLAPPQPKIDIRSLSDNSKMVSIIPSCRNTDYNGGCSLVDFKVIKNYSIPSGNTAKRVGEYLIMWEDSEQGSDYDQDLMGILRYELTQGASGDTLEVSTRLLSIATSNDMGFGFVIRGVNNEGFYALSAANDFSYCPDFSGSKDNCKGLAENGSRTFTITGSQDSPLESPLYYAAKWGGFIDKNKDNKPDNGEWNHLNEATGLYESTPRNYANINNPERLNDSLNDLLYQISTGGKTATGNSSSTNSADGTGITLQTYYEPKFQLGSQVVQWVGGLNGFFKDRFGTMREDNNGNGVLDNSDKGVLITTTNGETTFSRFDVDPSTGTSSNHQTQIPLHQIKPLWNARDRLAETTNPKTQRNYTSASGRYIFTGKTFSQTGDTSKVTDSIAFTAASFDADNTDGLAAYRFLADLPSPATSPTTMTHTWKLVNHLRGDTTDIPGARNRSVKFNPNDSSARLWLLGDIVHAKPHLVRGASEFYDSTLGDSSYQTFRNQIKNRRHMVYVGANDGMLHAFNAGFYDVNTNSYNTTASGKTTRALGSELWAYTPFNLLPHLKWLLDPDYQHVPYVDGNVQSFDVKIFNDDAAHPGGWGTILVVASRFGGGSYTFDHDRVTATAPITLRSSLMVFDVTDPESAPTLLGEFADARLGFTTTNFDVQRDGSTWNLVFGSGPTHYNHSSTQNAYVFKLPLTLTTSPVSIAASSLTAIDTGETNSWVGGVKAEDWNRDGTHEVVYFSTAGAGKGSLRRLLGSTTSRVLSITDREFASAPFTLLSSSGDAWIFAGTGKFLTNSDKTPLTGAQRFYAIKEKFSSDSSIDTTEFTHSQLLDITAYNAFSDGSLRDGAGTALERKSLESTIKSSQGWRLDFSSNERISQTPQVSNGKNLLFTTFAPGTGCNKGSAYLYEREFFTGLPPSASKNWVDPSASVKEVADKILIADIPTSINITADDKVTAVKEDMSVSEFSISKEPVNPGRQAWRELLINR
jgi:type IV pilus assembly protein PilY1